MPTRSLREWRLERLLSIKGLAAKAGVSSRTIVDIEYGRVVPKLRTIRRLSEALEVDPREVEEFSVAIERLGKDTALNSQGRVGKCPSAGSAAVGRPEV